MKFFILFAFTTLAFSQYCGTYGGGCSQSSTPTMIFLGEESGLPNTYRTNMDYFSAETCGTESQYGSLHYDIKFTCSEVEGKAVCKNDGLGETQFKMINNDNAQKAGFVCTPSIPNGSVDVLQGMRLIVGSMSKIPSFTLEKTDNALVMTSGASPSTLPRVSKEGCSGSQPTNAPSGNNTGLIVGIVIAVVVVIIIIVVVIMMMKKKQAKLYTYITSSLHIDKECYITRSIKTDQSILNRQKSYTSSSSVQNMLPTKGMSSPPLTVHTQQNNHQIIKTTNNKKEKINNNNNNNNNELEYQSKKKYIESNTSNSINNHIIQYTSNNNNNNNNNSINPSTAAV
ncbi:hypothetical protein WA158_007516 [Blastocystis sp. Blastoise]